MLAKLNPGVDFINIFRARFSRAKQNVTRKNTFVLKTQLKMRAKNVGEIDPWLAIVDKVAIVVLGKKNFELKNYITNDKIFLRLPYFEIAIFRHCNIS